MDKYRQRISEFCIGVTGCGFNGLVAKCDEFGETLFAFEKKGKEQDEYVSKFCCSLTFRIILRISSQARNFCSSLNRLKDGSRDNKKRLSSSTSVSSIFSVAKSAVVTPRKLWFTSFFQTFRGSSYSSICELFASSSFSFL